MRQTLSCKWILFLFLIAPASSWTCLLQDLPRLWPLQTGPAENHRRWLTSEVYVATPLLSAVRTNLKASTSVWFRTTSMISKLAMLHIPFILKLAGIAAQNLKDWAAPGQCCPCLDCIDFVQTVQRYLRVLYYIHVISLSTVSIKAICHHSVKGDTWCD